MQNQENFLGGRHRRKYFEGWYFKCISADRKHAVAFIPGMAVDPGGRKHSFIQVIDAVSGKTWYYHFPYDAFRCPPGRFNVTIAGSTFGADGLSLGIDTDEGRVTGRLTFSDIHRFPTRWYNPGIMGPFTYIPFMECRHAIIHLYHQLHGTIDLDGKIMNFDGGVGYIEKDYGRSFPETYLWLQASHFASGNASFVFSRASIPFLGRKFPGFFAYYTNFDNITVRFATYNFSKLHKWQVDPVKRTCSGELRGPSGTLAFEASMDKGGRLRAPIDGLMDREIIESITARVFIRLTGRRGELLFEGSSSEAGMEICQ